METPDFKKGGGMLPVVAQDEKTGEVLMLAYMNEEAFRRTVESGKAWYYSRSRDKFWMKGEESGNVQIVKSIRTDCDADAIVIRIEQVGGAACHTGHRTCFYRKLENGEWITEGAPVFDPKEVYKK